MMGLDFTQIKDFASFKAKYSHRLFIHSDLDAKTQCRQWAMSVRGGYGQMRIEYETKSGLKVHKSTSPHQLAYMFAHDNLQLDPGLEISHLCANKLCLAEGHLWAESHQANLSRVKCHSKRVCRDLDGNPHDPPCIFM